ncbi:DUF2490 domain-containing protein [Legionella sp. 29fVS95]|uniref:DUF2490 domain-containing protein n=1 Tax=Legionella sp. 29fVS95 TaxID=3402813 RepID=UPI003AF7F1CF
MNYKVLYTPMNLSRFFYLLLILGPALYSPTSPAMQTTQKFWSILGLNTNIGKFSYQIEPQVRLVNDPRVLEQFLSRFSGGYNASSQWAFWLGTGWLSTAQDEDTKNQEFRLWQDVIYNETLNSNKIFFRSRIEQRRSKGSDQWGYRFRERILISHPLTTSISLVGSNEFFINFNRPDWLSTKTIDQNRLSIGLDQQASKWLNVGAGYLNQVIFSTPIQMGHVITFNVQIHLPGG